MLLALALIFLPMIFDGGGDYLGPAVSRIPEPPEIPVLPEPAPTRPVIIGDSLPGAGAPEADGTADRPADETAGETADEAADASGGASPDAPAAVLDDAGLPLSWTVRLGAFDEPDNAAALVERLRDAGHRAYARPGGTGREREMTLVYVGPVLDRAQADDYRTRLLEEFELPGMVVRFEPAPL